MAWNRPPGHQPAYNPAYGGQYNNYGQPQGYQQQQNPYGPPPQYPPHGYPGGWGGRPAPPPGVDPVLWDWFQALYNNNWSQFNSETCRLMIGMFDKDQSGTIDIYEFSALWKYIQQWKQCFDSFDRDRSGTIDANELQTAFTSFGYRLF
ncbi:Peflin [Acropora cervicornis]|uniref:Peflin n=1 Tax=Acropora cervicornis TaxID=6130 RepID=A0AAD9V1C5_ACRCE|nr:Peflin [Acropora cervicornis]